MWIRDVFFLSYILDCGWSSLPGTWMSDGVLPVTSVRYAVYNGLHKISQLSPDLYLVLATTLFFPYWVNFKAPKVACDSRKLHGVQRNFELQVAGNRIENFTKTPVFPGSARQGPGNTEQVRMGANQERKSLQTTSSGTKAMIHHQGWVGSYFNRSIPFGFLWCSYPVQKNVPLQAFFLCLINKSAR